MKTRREYLSAPVGASSAASRTRRDLFRQAATTGLALGLAAAGRPLLAIPEKGQPSSADDITLMNTALALEHEAIWAYGLAGASGLMSEKAKEVGLLFQGSHEIHRDLLVDSVKRKGGQPVERPAQLGDPVPGGDDDRDRRAILTTKTPRHQGRSAGAARPKKKPWCLGALVVQI